MTLSGLNCAIVNRFGGILQQHLPNRTKRLVFLASLCARLKETETFDNATLQKLNQVMALSNTESALKLPVQLSRAIWRGKSSYEIFNADVQKEPLEQRSIPQMAMRVLAAMPSWLRYESDAAIKKDVMHLLNNSPTVLGV